VNNPHRGTIHAIDAEVLEHRAWPGGQFILRLRAPACASAASAGTFIHLQCSPGIPMRRPLSILRANAAEGWVEVLYKVIGPGLQALSRAEPGETVSLLGPIGQGFRPDPGAPLHPDRWRRRDSAADVSGRSSGSLSRRALGAHRLLWLGTAISLRGQRGWRHTRATRRLARAVTTREQAGLPGCHQV
jgi:hypothetical protein